MNVAVQVK